MSDLIELYMGEAGKIVGDTSNARQSAEYDMETHISDEQAQVLMANAQTFYTLTVACLSTIPSA